MSIKTGIATRLGPYSFLTGQTGWRRGRDSNPGCLATRRFSRPVLSTTQPPLQRRRDYTALYQSDKKYPLIFSLIAPADYAPNILWRGSLAGRIMAEGVAGTGEGREVSRGGDKPNSGALELIEAVTGLGL